MSQGKSIIGRLNDTVETVDGVPEEKKIRVFLTGATGVMGMAGLKELSRFPERYDITVLARDSKVNRKKLLPYENKGVKVIWGDLLDPVSLRAGIENADIVLHVGGMVSPMAEYYPQKTLKVNIGSMKNIASIVKEMEAKEAGRTVKVVYIGSVSQYGSKLPPHHWGKSGDKLSAAKMDAYAVSKILAERALVEAGLKRWVSLRQTAILHGGLLKNASNPVTFHVPVNGVIEWISVEDSGRLLERVCRPEVPDFFWNNYYNAGGGEAFRMTNLEFERGILKALGCPPPEKVFDSKWFAADNFHGIWFEDSDYLDSLLHFREKDTFEAALSRLRKSLPAYYSLTPLVPAFLIKAVMKRVALSPGLGPLWWLKTNDEERIKAAWGSREEYDRLPGWKELKEPRLSKETPNKATCYKEIYGEKNSSVEENTEKAGSGFPSLTKVKCENSHEYFISDALKTGGHGCPYCLLLHSRVECPKN